MATLPPTVHERLARCGTRVFVDGLISGALVELDVGGTISTHTALAGVQSFIVPPLQAGLNVRARQDTGDGFSLWSPVVVVEDALVPPQAAPALPDEVGACSQCVRVTQLVPGCDVKVFLGSTVVGSGRANRHGKACLSIDLAALKGRRSGNLGARMYVCGAESPKTTTPIVSDPPLPKPVIDGPLYGCQRTVPLTNLRPGSRVQVRNDLGETLGSACACGTSVTLAVAPPLVTNEPVRGRALADVPCDELNTGAWEEVVPPDAGITPVILEAVVEGDQVIRVDNQIIGATLIIRILGAVDAKGPVEYGPRPASEEQEIALNEPLEAGNIVWVEQTLCGVSFESASVTVQPQPDEVYAPVIVPPLYDCGAAVQVSNLHPGALVRVYWNGLPVGVEWAGLESSLGVPLAPALVAGGTVTARQVVGGVESPESEPVPVLDSSGPQTPRIMKPVALGDTTMWLSRVSPGAHVTIRSGGVIIGEADAAEPITRVTVTPVAGPVTPTARLCASKATGSPVEPITSPCARGPFSKAGDQFLGLGPFTVPDTIDGSSLTLDIEGQIFFPASSDNTLHPDARDLPLVVIAHGFWQNEGVGSFLGYDYLARHLARWGMVVFSINMDDVNHVTGSAGTTHQYARAEIFLRAVELVLAHPVLGPRLNPKRIGLIGHSMAGEGAVAAQFLNESEHRGFNIRGVVSIAPTHWRPEIILRDTKYLQLFGSFDLLTLAMTGTDAEAHFSGFRIYDRAWRPKTHVWIHGARHNPFNRVWVADGDLGEGASLGLPPQDHERIAKCVINAFLVNVLLEKPAYVGYMEGTILPRSLAGLEIHTQHAKKSHKSIDNFGDVDQQLGVAATALDKDLNTIGFGVSVAGSGLVEWNDVEHTSLAHSPHNTKSVRLSWDQPNVRYRSNTGGVSRPLTNVLAMRIGQFYEDEALNPVATPVDLFVTLNDGTGDATLRLGSVAQVPYPDAATNILAPMRTVRLPLDAFKAANPDFDFSNIKSVSLRLIGRASGDIVADEIEFSG